MKGYDFYTDSCNATNTLSKISSMIFETLTNAQNRVVACQQLLAAWHKTSNKVFVLRAEQRHNTVQFDAREPMPRLSRFLFGRWLHTHWR